VEIIVDLHEHGGPNRKVDLVETNDPAVTDVLQLEAHIAGGVVELWKLEDSVRQSANASHGRRLVSREK
jgi:hypothetical protein